MAAALGFAADSLSGRRAPSFSLPDSSNRQHDILDYRGKWLVLTYTTTLNCPICGPFAKALDALQSKASVLNVMLSPPENFNTAARFVTDNRLTAPVVFDQSQTAIAYYKATPTNSRIDTPHTFIIDPNGRIISDWSAEQVKMIVDGKRVAAALQEAMSHK